ncbi:unnamed protein product [Meganyctiphanes norvegica]|uniref:DOMON domain-containing protein n=1 Tax=Meganyctiphanes norvegica TaxID=48144 RepID=A0AAV2QWI3_MEGNR
MVTFKNTKNINNCDTKPEMAASRTSHISRPQLTRPSSMIFLVVFLVIAPRPSTQFLQPGFNFPKPSSPEETWLYSALVDPDGFYLVQWTPLEEEVLFRLTVKTTGYISFGLSNGHEANGADIVVGWVHSGKAYLQDRHSVGHQEPAVDEQQDWVLESGYENETHTVLIISRPYDTCDEDDFVITSDTVILLWAYHHDDPVDPEHAQPHLHHHSSHRGATNIVLLERGQKEVSKNLLDAYVEQWRPAYRFPLLQSPEDRKWYLMSQYTEIPAATDTTMWCMFKRPEIGIKHHVVRFEPVIKPGHEEMIQSMVVYECTTDSREVDQALEEIVYQRAHKCNRESMNSLTYSCNHVMMSWTKGSKGFTYPDEVGYPLDPTGTKFFMLEVQYSSVDKTVWDSAGFKLVYTPELRMHDAGVLNVGVSPSWKHMIPPQEKIVLSEGHCVGECTKEALPYNGIHVFGALHSTHGLGRKIRVRHLRNGQELKPISQDSNHNPNYTEFRTFHHTRQILPGDHLITECQYNSMEKREITLGGNKAHDETCQAFLMYWPRVDLSVCQSKPSLNTILTSLGIHEMAINTEPVKISSPEELSGKTLEWRIINYNWKTQFQYFQKTISNGNFSPTCQAKGYKIVPGLEEKNYNSPRISAPWTTKKCKPTQKRHQEINTKPEPKFAHLKANREFMNDAQSPSKPMKILDVDLVSKKQDIIMPIDKNYGSDKTEIVIAHPPMPVKSQLKEKLWEMELELEEEVKKKYREIYTETVQPKSTEEEQENLNYNFEKQETQYSLSEAYKTVGHSSHVCLVFVGFIVWAVY